MGVVPKRIYSNRTVEATKDLHNLKFVRTGDFVISLRSFQGGIEYAYYQGIISPAYTVMIPNDHITGGYFRYLAKSRLFIELLQMCVTGIREGQNIDYMKLKNHLIPLPPRDEQDQIVRYLDWKVSQISRLINAKRRQIALLEEKKHKAINKVVTKEGESWVKGRIGQFYDITLGKMLQPNKKSDNEIYANYMCAVNIKWTGIKLNPIKQMWFSKNELSQYLIQRGDLLVTEGGDVGVSSIWNNELDECYIQNSVHLVRSNKNNTQYLYYCLFNLKIIGWIDNVCNKATIAHFTKEKLANAPLTLPPTTEQDAIVKNLDEQCGRFDRLIGKINDKIVLYTEYRTRLISDVVTGKIDVCGVAVPEYVIVEEVVSIDRTEDDDVIAAEIEGTAPEAKNIILSAAAMQSKGHNQQIDDAVMIAGIVHAFYHEKYPLGRKKIQKLLYFIRRHQDEDTAAFKKKAAGPYADKVRYKGGEPIAKTNKYIITITEKGKGTTFTRGENITQALEYIKKWDAQSDIQWLIDKFRYTKVDDLELLATVDMAICDLGEAGIPVSVSSIRHLIATSKEWKDKLNKQTFNDSMISKAISELETLL
jgi:type I restriction enzyme S subunit